MKVFVCGTSFQVEYGGPAISVSQLAEAMAKAGAEIGLWAPDGSAKLVASAVPALRRFDGSLGAALEMFGKPDVVHDSEIWLPVHREIAAQAHRLGVRRVVSIRGTLEPWAFRHKKIKKRLAWMLYQKRDLQRADLLHATADMEARSIQGFGLGVPVVVIPNGIELPGDDQPGRSYRPGQARVALFLGRINPKKGLPMLIKAWAEVRPENWELCIAGPDEAGHRAEVENLVRTMELSDVVSFRGVLQGAAKAAAYAEAEMAVLPTYSENFGMAVAEGLAYGLPVLTTKGAPWESLETHRCGWWVDPTVAGIAEGLRRATAASDGERREMGRRGRELAKTEFGWDRIAGRMLAAYDNVLSKA